MRFRLDCFFCFFLAFFAVLCVNASHLKYWTEVDFYLTHSPSLSSWVWEENCWSHDHYSQELTLGFLRVKAADWVSFGFDHAMVYSREEGVHSWGREQRPGIDMTLQKEFSGWRLVQRSWAMWRSRPGEKDFLRLRERLRLHAPWRWTSLAIAPYVSQEIFFEDKEGTPGDKWDQLRSQAGLNYRLSKRTTAGTYYMCQYERSSGDWTPNHIFGATISFDF